MSAEAELPETAPRSVPPAFLALVAPEQGMDRQAKVGTAKAAFLVAFACAVLSAFAQSSRVDARSVTLASLDKAGRLTEMSEKQVDDEVRNAERLSQVVLVAKGVLKAPAFLLLDGLAALGLIWFLKGKIKGRAIFPVAAATLLPSAIADLLDAGSAWLHKSLSVDNPLLAPRTLSAALASLGHPLEGPLFKLGTAFDFFSLWAAVMMAYGVVSGGDVPRKRAIVGTLVAWICLRLLVGVAAGG